MKKSDFESIEDWEEYQKTRRYEKCYRYKVKNIESVIDYRRRRKVKLIKDKGGKCLICGYNKLEYPSVFHFHHRDPSQKEFEITGRNIKLEKVMKELEKCDLLCCRCHAELHDKKYINERKISIEKYENRLNEIKEKKLELINLVQNKKRIIIEECFLCKKKFEKKAKDQKFCSNICSSASTRKIEHPTKEILEKEIKENTWSELGRKYGVSYNSVKKWAKKYGLL